MKSLSPNEALTRALQIDQLTQVDQFMSARSKLFPSLITAADVIEFRSGWDKM